MEKMSILIDFFLLQASVLSSGGAFWSVRARFHMQFFVEMARCSENRMMGPHSPPSSISMKRQYRFILW